MASIAPKGQPERQSFTLAVWSASSDRYIQGMWQRLWLVKDEHSDTLSLYHQQLREPMVFPIPMPGEGKWRTLNIENVSGPELMYQLASWGIKPKRAQVERAEDV